MKYIWCITLLTSTNFCRARGNRTPIKGFGDLYSTVELWPFQPTLVCIE